MSRIILIAFMVLLTGTSVFSQACTYTEPPSSILLNVNGGNLQLPVTKKFEKVIVSNKKNCVQQTLGGCLKYQNVKITEHRYYIYACPDWQYQTQPDPNEINNRYAITGFEQRCLPVIANFNTLPCENFELTAAAFSSYTMNFNLAYLSYVITVTEQSNKYNWDSNPSTWTVTSTIHRYFPQKSVVITPQKFFWKNDLPESICPSGSINFQSQLGTGVNVSGISWSIVQGGGSISGSGNYTPGAYTGQVKIRATKTFYNGGPSYLEHTFSVSGLVDINSKLPESICSDSGIIDLRTGFEWAGDYTPVFSSTSHPAAVSGVNFNPNFAGEPSTFTDVTIKVAITASGCTGSATKTVRIGPGNWSIAGVSNMDVCKNVPTYALTGTPVNGGSYSTSWSGVGVSGTTFSTAGVSAGENYPVTYTVNRNGCIKSKSATISVYVPSELSVTNPNVSPNCGASSINLLAAIAPMQNGNLITSNITWSSTAPALAGKISGNILNTTGVPLNSYPITFQYTTINGCVNSMTIPAAIVLNSSGIAPPIVPTVYACQQGDTRLKVTNYDPDSDYYWYDAATGGNIVGTGEVFQTPYLTANAKYWVQSKKLTCQSNRVESNVIMQNVSASAGPDILFCSASEAIQTLSGTPSGGTWSGPGVTGNQFNGTGFETNKKYELTYTYLLNGCTYTSKKSAHIGFEADITITPNKDVYFSGDLVQFSHNLGSESEAIWTLQDENYYSTFFETNPGQSYIYAEGEFSIILSLTNSGGCQATFSKNLTFLKTVITGNQDDRNEPISVYPNPFTQGIVIAGGFPKEISIALNDSYGRMLFSKKLSSQVDGNYQLGPDVLPDLKPGVYFLHLIYNNEKKIIKVIKQ